MNRNYRAYQDGYKNGKADKALGIRTTYAWALKMDYDSPEHFRHYGRGYRDGWIGLTFEERDVINKFGM